MAKCAGRGGWLTCRGEVEGPPPRQPRRIRGRQGVGKIGGSGEEVARSTFSEPSWSTAFRQSQLTPPEGGTSTRIFRPIIQYAWHVSRVTGHDECISHRKQTFLVPVSGCFTRVRFHCRRVTDIGSLTTVAESKMLPGDGDEPLNEPVRPHECRTPVHPRCAGGGRTRRPQALLPHADSAAAQPLPVYRRLRRTCDFSQRRLRGRVGGDDRQLPRCADGGTRSGRRRACRRWARSSN